VSELRLLWPPQGSRSHWPAGILTSPFAITYSYDAASNRIGMVDPQNAPTVYGYDSLNRLSSLLSPVSATPFGFSYDALNRRTQMTRPNGVNTNYNYDGLSRLLSVLHQVGTSTPLDGATYTYDNAGNRLTRQNKRTNATTNYGYDSIYQLTSATGDSTESYSYDPVGNRLSSMGVPNYTVNSSNELTSTSNATYTYDANGNIVTKIDSSGSTGYNWDFENRLTSVVLPGTGGTVSLKYDPFGRRIQKTSNVGTGNYVYDSADLLEEVNPTGVVIARYTMGSGIDQPMAMVRGGSTSFYHSDGLGSITGLTDGTGAQASTYSYDSFGNLMAATGNIINPFRYTAREFDSETGLMYYRARYYDPVVGRFLSQDPIGFNSGMNSYAYVFNNPLTFVDPLGLDALTDDPAVRKCMCLLWKASNYGFHETEESAWVLLLAQLRSCSNWPATGKTSKQVWTGPVPTGAEGIVHTHPIHAWQLDQGFPKIDPMPSQHGKPSDKDTAHDNNIPVYPISDQGVWKIDPNGNVTQEVQQGWLDDFDKNCNCKPKKKGKSK
jgi:RHS repeat-associated protein